MKYLWPKCGILTPEGILSPWHSKTGRSNTSDETREQVEEDIFRQAQFFPLKLHCLVYDGGEMEATCWRPVGNGPTVRLGEFLALLATTMQIFKVAAPRKYFNRLARRIFLSSSCCENRPAHVMLEHRNLLQLYTNTNKYIIGNSWCAIIPPEFRRIRRYVNRDSDRQQLGSSKEKHKICNGYSCLCDSGNPVSSAVLYLI